MRCTNGQGHTENHPADGWVVSPDGKRIVRQCRAHAEEVASEYAEKLGERWSFEPFDTPPALTEKLAEIIIDRCDHDDRGVQCLYCTETLDLVLATLRAQPEGR